MATEAEVKQALQQLIDYYAPKDMAPKRLAVYAAQLQRLDGGVLEDAVKRCLTTLTWFPKLNELFKIANELPVKAKEPNLLRARAFELEHKRAEGAFIESEWQTLADSYRRLDKLESQRAVLDRMEAYSGSEYDTDLAANAVSGDATEFIVQNGVVYG